MKIINKSSQIFLVSAQSSYSKKISYEKRKLDDFWPITNALPIQLIYYGIVKKTVFLVVDRKSTFIFGFKLKIEPIPTFEKSIINWTRNTVKPRFLYPPLTLKFFLRFKAKGGYY